LRKAKLAITKATTQLTAHKAAAEASAKYIVELEQKLDAANQSAAGDRDASAQRVTELKHKLRCAEQDAAKKDAAHAEHIRKLTTELSNTKLAVAAATATIESTRAAERAELERRLAELAAREESLRDRLHTLDDTNATLVLERDAATEQLEGLKAALDSAGLAAEERDLLDRRVANLETELRDATAFIASRNDETARIHREATALREQLAAVVAASAGLRTVLTTRVAHLEEKLDAANNTAASDRDALTQRVTELKHKLRCAEQDAAKKDAAHADHIQKLTTELSNTKLAVAAATATIESKRAAERAELERRLAELAAREESLRDRLHTLDDTNAALVLERDAATEQLEGLKAALDSAGVAAEERDLLDRRVGGSTHLETELRDATA
jgi:chromosome segregation ATPase